MLAMTQFGHCAMAGIARQQCGALRSLRPTLRTAVRVGLPVALDRAGVFGVEESGELGLPVRVLGGRFLRAVDGRQAHDLIERDFDVFGIGGVLGLPPPVEKLDEKLGGGQRIAVALGESGQTSRRLGDEIAVARVRARSSTPSQRVSARRSSPVSSASSASAKRASAASSGSPPSAEAKSGSATSASSGSPVLAASQRAASSGPAAASVRENDSQPSRRALSRRGLRVKCRGEEPPVRR